MVPTFTAYKLTDRQLNTRDDTKWEVGKWNKLDSYFPRSRKDRELCSDQFFHCYLHPLYALRFFQDHVDYDSGHRLFRCEIRYPHFDLDSNDRVELSKLGCRQIRLVEELEWPDGDKNIGNSMSWRLHMDDGRYLKVDEAVWNTPHYFPSPVQIARAIGPFKKAYHSVTGTHYKIKTKKLVD